MGKTERSTGATNLNNSINKFGNDLNNQNFQTTNRFNDYKPEFSSGQMSGNLDALFNSARTNLDYDANTAMRDASRDTVARLASQGITGGSILNDAVTKSTEPIMKNKYSSVRDLATNRMGMQQGLMNQANQNKFQTTSAAQGVDVQNILNQMRKYGMLQGNLGLQMNNLQNLDDTNFLDDILSVANAGANVAGAFMGKP